MRALITGIDGFVGYYLSEHLINERQEVFGTTIVPEYTNEKVTLFSMNLLDKSAVEQVIKAVQPDTIYHLAGQSAVGLSWQKPSLTMSINVNGTIHLLEAVRDYCKEAKVLIIGSSDQYGPIKEEDCPITEEHPLRPVSPYGISKVAQEEMAKLFIRSYNMNIIMVRAFNHIGPRQGINFVIADFASKIARIEKGMEPTIKVGNLEVYRDFTDVRDIIRGYYMLMQTGQIGEVYNIGSGKGYKIKDMLYQLLNITNKQINIESDSSKIRPIDVTILVCDNSKIKSHVGWRPTVDISTSLQDTLDYWRTMEGEL